MNLHILKSGLQTCLQDFGRPGHRDHGVPLSGAADKLSLALANFCVGNAPDAVGLEITLTGPKIEFETAADFAICGAPIPATLNHKPVALNKPYSVNAGDILDIGSAPYGARTYLAIAGGIEANTFLGSASTYSYAKVGGHEGRRLNKGDHIGFGTSVSPSQALPIGFAPNISDTLILRALPGPEWERLTEASQRKLTSKAYIAGARTDRMGAQLDGPNLALKNKSQMISSAILPGTLQVPQSGQPILMGPDGHCTGGYPRALQVIRADRHLMGQIKPSSRIHFVMSTEVEALDILKTRTALYQSLMPQFSF